MTPQVGPNSNSHKGPVIAALDLGSNSFHLVVAMVRPNRSFDIIASEKRMLRLGEEVASMGRVSQPTIARAVQTVVELSKVATLAGAGEILAFATSAFRDAENSEALVDAIEAASGVHAHVVSGLREAQTIYHAVRSHLSLSPTPALIADLGGGSLELIVGDQRQSYFTTSLPLGVGRLKASFVRGDQISEKERKSLKEHIERVVAPSLESIVAFDPRCLILSSGTFGALLRMANLSQHARVPEMVDFDDEPVAVHAVELLGQKLVELPLQKRLALPGAEEKRIDLLPVGWMVLQALLEVVKVDQVRFSSWALREGMILDALEARSDFEFAFEPSELRNGSVAALAERYHALDEHSSRVREFAIEIANTMFEIADLSTQDIELLGHAATLHDIGEWIARDSHDRHGAYIVDSSVLKGFTEYEKSIISSIVRFHKRGTPKVEDHAPFRRLKPKVRTQVVKLASILRIADSLDRSHGAAIESIESSTVGNVLVVYVKTNCDISLELNGFRKKKGLFEEVFGMDAELYPSPAVS